MAIEVIEKGERPDNRIYKARCYQCKALLQFKRADAKWHPDQRDGDYLQITCPECAYDSVTVLEANYER